MLHNQSPMEQYQTQTDYEYDKVRLLLDHKKHKVRFIFDLYVYFIVYLYNCF